MIDPIYIGFFLGIVVGGVAFSKKFRQDLFGILSSITSSKKPKKKKRRVSDDDEEEDKIEFHNDNDVRVIRKRRGTTIREIHFDD